MSRAWPAALLLALSALGTLPSGVDRAWMSEARWVLPILALGLAAAWSLWLGNPRFLPDTPVALAAWGVAAAQALSAMGAGMTETGAFRVAQWASLALAVSWASRLDAPGRRRILGTLAALGALTAALVILQRAGRDPFALRAGCHGPGAATFFHKGLAAAFLSLALPAALALALEGSGLARAALAILVLGLSWCDTRAAWLGGAAGGLVLAALLVRSVPRRTLAVALGVAAAAVLLGWISLSRSGLAGNLGSRIRGIVSGPDSNRRLRTAYWGVCLDAWMERPWLGHGPGTFRDAAYPVARRLPPESWDGISLHAHNDLLETAVESGVPGATSLLLLGAAILASVARGGGDARVRAASAGVLAAGAVNAMLVFPLSDAGCALALAFGAGFLSGERPAGPRRRGRAVLAALALVATLLSLRLPAAAAFAISGRPAPAVALAPALEPPRHLASERALDARDPARAQAELRGILRFHPSSSKACSGLGNIRLLAGDFAPARALLERARTLEPWNAVARMNLAIARFHQGDPPAAYAELALCLRVLPDFGPAIHGTWGRLLVMEGKDPIGAIEHLEAFLKHRPGEAERRDAEAWLGRARRQLAQAAGPDPIRP